MTDGMTLEEEAIALLLRSPQLEVGTIIDLLDISFHAEYQETLETPPDSSVDLP